MKKIFLTFLFSILFGLPVFAQTIPKPTLDSTEPTSAQKQLISEGIQLRKEKRFDEAIVKYQKVLEQNENCTAAIYELSLAYYYDKKLEQALEVSLVGAKYRSKLLPLFIQNIGNITDDQGNPQKAVEFYKQGIKILNDNEGSPVDLSVLHYNLGLTYARQKSYKESREVLKKSIEFDFSYPNPNYIIAAVFDATNYKIPALLAAGRFITLENNTQRSKVAAQIITKVMGGNVQKGDKPNSIKIFVNSDAPTDEGDFGALELFLGLSKVGAETLEKNKNKTDEEKFVGQVQSFVNIFLERGDKNVKDTFVGKNYLPFYREMKAKGYVEAFAYLILQETGNRNADKWIADNNNRIFDFVNWAKNFQI
ncbi:MAG: tetratricopeptide repeat protein [Pyrinomonadaceae bacterium]